MKKYYEAPAVELVKFNYADQVVAASSCENYMQYRGNTGNGDNCHPQGYSRNL